MSAWSSATTGPASIRVFSITSANPIYREAPRAAPATPWGSVSSSPRPCLGEPAHSSASAMARTAAARLRLSGTEPAWKPNRQLHDEVADMTQSPAVRTASNGERTLLIVDDDA